MVATVALVSVKVALPVIPSTSFTNRLYVDVLGGVGAGSSSLLHALLGINKIKAVIIMSVGTMFLIFFILLRI
jgi:ABC-type cobalamin/Fe3+-siderophores transport system ATPase subunit